MIRLPLILGLALPVTLAVMGVRGDSLTSPTKSLPPHPGYTTQEASRDGTGKFYLGREIAQVMGHPAIPWLERTNRDDEENTTRAVKLLQLKTDEVLADIGAGSGYYSFQLAGLLPKGKVIAVDIQPEMIAFLESRKKKGQVTNIESHLGAVDDTKLPAGSIDSALMIDAYHEFSHPYEMMTSIFRALKPGGRVILLEYRLEDPKVPIKLLHKMSQKQIKKEMQAVGLIWERTEDELPWQHLMIFRKPKS